MSDLTTTEDILTPKSTSTKAMVAKNVIFYKKDWLVGNHDAKNYFIKLGRRGRRFLKEGDSIKLAVQNLEAATDSIYWMAHGRFTTHN